MTCEQLLLALNEYVDGTLDVSLCATFEAHLAGCSPCQVVIDNIRRTITLYKEGEAYELPADTKERLHDALRERWKRAHPPA